MRTRSLLAALTGKESAETQDDVSAPPFMNNLD